jgi:hypothetical protein
VATVSAGRSENQGRPRIVDNSWITISPSPLENAAARSTVPPLRSFNNILALGLRYRGTTSPCNLLSWRELRHILAHQPARAGKKSQKMPEKLGVLTPVFRESPEYSIQCG